ncbi:MAG TPA: SprT family zinc-dependent metalloprotease [Sphingomicrobium sp.]|nr:SprT family zinc-dependent metalloprotease [Sphingomicrobium sp.]
MSSSARSKALVRHEGLPLPVELHGLRGARRLRLRLDDTRGVLKLTGPLRMNRKAALEWAAEQRSWVERQVAAMPPAEPFEPGVRIPLEGIDVELLWDEGAPRSPRLQGGQLTCGGPREGFQRRIERFLKQLALDTLSTETKELCRRAGLTPPLIGVGDAGSRWGSCSASGRIRYSWRLILAPPDARRYVVAHEVAHLRHMDHGREFKALERQLFEGDAREARLLLRSVGPRLRRVGRRD